MPVHVDGHCAQYAAYADQDCYLSLQRQRALDCHARDLGHLAREGSVRQPARLEDTSGVCAMLRVHAGTTQIAQQQLRGDPRAPLLVPAASRPAYSVGSAWPDPAKDAPGYTQVAAAHAGGVARTTPVAACLRSSITGVSARAVPTPGVAA